MASVEERVANVVVETLGVDRNVVTKNASYFNDLGADSLDTVELMMALEEEFDIDIADSEAEQIHTVGETVSAVNSKLG